MQKISPLPFLASFLLFFAFTLTAAAQNRTIDFAHEITSLTGGAIQNPTSPVNPKPTNATLGDIAVNALETPLRDDTKLSGEDKFKMDALARKIYRQKAVALSPTEIKLLKDRIGEIYSAAVVGPAWKLLDEAK